MKRKFMAERSRLSRPSIKSKMLAFGWAKCARCGDVHKKSDRIPVKQPQSWFILCCPQCMGGLMAPLAEVPVQRSIFEVMQ